MCTKLLKSRTRANHLFAKRNRTQHLSNQGIDKISNYDFSQKWALLTLALANFKSQC